MRLMNKELLLDQCPVLWHKELTEDVLREDFDVRSGQWRVEEGWLYGENRGNFPGMVISRKDFYGNVLLEFTANTVLPSTHDINAMWNGSWNEQTNTRDVAYVGGLEGWWHGKVGFEKSPDYKLIDGHAFIIIDGALVLEVTDPDPIDTAKYGRFGFEAYCSSIRIRDVYLRRAVAEAVEESYNPEF
jgi:hypothetical protein